MSTKDAGHEITGDDTVDYQASGEEIAASQQVGDELPGGIKSSGGIGPDMDSFSRTGAIDPDDPNPTNTAAGFSVGGTGTGIEPGVDAALGTEEDPDDFVADVYGDSKADIDGEAMADELGLGPLPHRDPEE
jgi:hypothetical protein